MTKDERITLLSSALCEQLQNSMLEACRKVATGRGLVVESAGWRNLDNGLAFEPVFRVSIPAADGTAFNLEKDMFAYLAEHNGLAASDFGREFTTGSERFRIPASIQNDRNTPSPPSAFPTGAASSSPPKTSPCC